MKFFLLAATIFLASMTKSCDPSIEQGLAGQVLWLEGDMMPSINDSPDVNRKRFKKEPIKRTIHIYELTTMDQAIAEGPFFKNITTKKVESVETDEEGKFLISLPTGKYSVFVEEEPGLFASIFDGEGAINPVEIKEKEISTIQIEVNYKATY